MPLTARNEYDITCEWRTTAGTRLKKMEFAMFGYLKNARAKDTQDMIDSHNTASLENADGSLSHFSKMSPLRTSQSREIELAWKKKGLEQGNGFSGC